MTKASNLTPTPNTYMPLTTNTGNKLGVDKGGLVAQVRGTFGQNERFQQYKVDAYTKTTPTIGPQNYNAIENFRSQKNKHCRVIMQPQKYKSQQEAIRSLSRKSNNSDNHSLRSGSSRRSFVQENIRAAGLRAE